MPVNRARLIITSLFLVWVLACVNTGGLEPPSKPTRSLSITFDESQRGEFCKRLNTFAKKNGFDITIQGMDEHRNCTTVQLLGDDNDPYIVVENQAIFDDKTSNPDLPEPTQVHFFVEGPETPEALATIDALVNDLTDLIGDIPTIEVSE